MKAKLLHISLKMTLAGVIALLLAYFLNITYYTTAAAIAILSIQWTKRDFINIAIKRFISGLAAIIISALLFYFLGNSFWVFALFLVLFTNLSWFFNAPEGIVPSVVLVTHFLVVTNVTLSFVLEETLLLLIAILVAFIINMTYPQFNNKSLKRNLLDVDNIIKDELKSLSYNIKQNTCHVDRVSEARRNLKKIMSEAKMVDRNIIMQNDHRYITYLYMRKTQLTIIKRINYHLCKIEMKHEYHKLIADFINKISDNISFNDRASVLITDLGSLRTYFIEAKLPSSREEFEVRAMLFQIINEIETFLKLKIDFHTQYPTFNQKGEGNYE